MKFIDREYSVAIVAVLVLSMAFVADMIGAPDEPAVAYPEEKKEAIILASAQSHAVPNSTAQPDTLPAPCPIWMISQLMPQEGSPGQSNGGPTDPKLVPAALWFMQRFGQALGKNY